MCWIAGVLAPEKMRASGCAAERVELSRRRGWCAKRMCYHQALEGGGSGVLVGFYMISMKGVGVYDIVQKDEMRVKGKMVEDGRSDAERLRLRCGLGSARDGRPSCDQAGQVRGYHEIPRVQSCDVSGTTNGTGTTG